MAAREGLVGSLSRGLLLPLPWKQSGATRAMEGTGGKREGAESSSAGELRETPGQGSSHVSPHSGAPASVLLLCCSSSSSVSPGTLPPLGSPQK